MLAKLGCGRPYATGRDLKRLSHSIDKSRELHHVLRLNLETFRDQLSKLSFLWITKHDIAHGGSFPVTATRCLYASGIKGARDRAVCRSSSALHLVNDRSDVDREAVCSPTD